MRIAHLFVYPVKSARGIAVSSAEALGTGLHRDRHFMVVDDAGRFFTQREAPALARLGVRIKNGDEAVVLTSGARELSVAWASDPRAELREVTVWTDTVTVEDAGDDAADLVSELVGESVRLVRFGGRSKRALDPRYGEGTTEFADGSPVLVASLASLPPLAPPNDPSRVPTIRRFRANVVIDGEIPFDEERVERVFVGGGAVVFRLVKRCPRCPVIDVDPDTGVRDKGTLANLARARPAETTADRALGEKRAVYFGMDAIVERPGRVAVGDPVTFG